MTNRAHHPADSEFTSEERPGPSPKESGPVPVEKVMPRDLVPSATRDAASPERAAASAEDADEEEVVPEPDSVSAPPVQAPAVSSHALASDAASSDPLPAAIDTAVDAPGPDERITVVPAIPLSGSEALQASAAEADAAGDAPSKPAAASRSEPPPALDSSPTGSRRTSRPPPLGAVVTAEELVAPRGAFTGPAAAEVTAAELENAAAPNVPLSVRSDAPVEGPSVPRPSFRPPFVDEVPDPVTPYEKRVSETVKVADLPPVEQLRGRVLANRYLAEEVAEHTACSISYRAYHLALDRAVLVRVLLRGLACSDEACQEVRRVAAAATALDSPHVAATLDFGVLSDGWPFVVTEYFQGSTLSTLLSGEGKFVLRRVLHIGKQLAQGLSIAHEKGIVHGLFSPDNVLVVDPGSSAEIAKILGFGISKARGSVPGPPRSGVFGVPFYVSPEQAACRPFDARSDIYSLGVVLYELMTGAPPFSDGDFAGVLCQHLDDDAAPPSSRLSSPGALAKALDAIIERCLRKEPERRYQTAAEVADDLVRLEAAAARTKRRPMPEVQKPTTTIHSPHRKAETHEAPGAKVIVHDDLDEPASPEVPEVSARRSSPSLPRSSPPTAGGVSSKSPGSSPGAGRSSSRPPPLSPTTPARGALPKPARVRVDQATIKISAVDRERLLAERSGQRGSSWLGSVVAAIRRLIAPEPGSSDDSR